MDPLMLIIGCDCDPDRPAYGGSRYDVYRPSRRWQGVVEGIRDLQGMLESLGNSLGLKPKIIFCVRSDLQMKEIYGSAGWMLQEYRSLWRELAGQGHEIAWHPHLWRWSDTSGCWYQEAEDEEWIVRCLEIGHADFVAEWGAPVTCHMGWTFHNNISMQTVSRLGLEMDFSATPGVFFEGGPGAAGTKFDNRIDWRGTPQAWYRPSARDYRRPPGSSEGRLDLIEIPKFTSEAGLLKTAKHLAHRSKKSPVSEEARAVFLQITALPLFYGRIVRERLKAERVGPFFATYFHPDELLKNRPVSAKGFLYSINHMRTNLANIIEKARNRGREISFVTGREAVDFLPAQQ